MANVTKRASRQFTVQDSGTATHALPTGSVAGDLLLAWCEDGGRRSNRPADTTGWTSSAHAFGALWSKRLTAADITAGSVTLLGEVTGLLACVNGSGIGQRRDGHQITRSVAGAAVVVTAFAPPSASTVNPTADRLDSVVDHEDWPHTWYFLPGDGAAGLKGLSGIDPGASYYAWEILPVVGPNAPTLSTPLAGAEVEAGINHTLTWVHNSTSGATQTGYRIRYREVGVTAYWLYIDAYGYGDTVEHDVASASQSAVVDSSVFTTGKNWEWAVATQDEGTWSSYSASQAFWSRPAPVVDDIGVSSPAEDLTPLLTVAWTMGYGTVAAWQVRVTLSGASSSDDGTVYDSGVMAYAGVQEHVIPATDDDGVLRWANGTSYVGWVLVQQQGGLWSDWTVDATPFTTSWTPPAAPSAVTVVDGAPPTVHVETIPSGCGVEVEWTTDPGAGWTALVSLAAADADEEIPAPLAPYNTGVWARARSVEVIDGQPITSAWETSSATVTTDTGSYLVDPDDPSDYLRVRMLDSDRSPLQGVTVSVGHGATAPRVDSTTVAGWRFRLTVATRTRDEYEALADWLTGKASWWARWAPELDAFGARSRRSRTPDLITRAAPLDSDRIADGPLSNRVIEIGCVTQ